MSDKKKLDGWMDGWMDDDDDDDDLMYSKYI